MEPKGSLLHSQASSTCLYPEPDQSSPHFPIPLIEYPLILSSFLRLDLPTGIFLWGFPTKPCIHLSRHMYSPSHYSWFNFVLGAAIVTARTERQKSQLRHCMLQGFDEVEVKVEVMHMTF